MIKQISSTSSRITVPVQNFTNLQFRGEWFIIHNPAWIKCLCWIICVCVCVLVDTSFDTKLTPEAHVKRSIVVRTLETRDGEVNTWRRSSSTFKCSKKIGHPVYMNIHLFHHQLMTTFSFPTISQNNEMNNSFINFINWFILSYIALKQKCPYFGPNIKLDWGPWAKRKCCIISKTVLF